MKNLSGSGLSRFKMIAIVTIVVVAISVASYFLFLSPKTVTLILTSSATTSTVNGFVTLTSTLSVQKDGAVKLYWKINDSGFDFSTNEMMVDGVFARTFGFGQPGVWRFKVVWQGDNSYGSVESNIVTVDVSS